VGRLKRAGDENGPRRARVCGITESGFTMPNDAELKAEIERLRAENEALKRPRGQMSMKVSEKGGLSVYGLGRFPVTLYREQWEKLLAMSDELRQFIKDHDEQLKRKE
jgi:hypothetical protein